MNRVRKLALFGSVALCGALAGVYGALLAAAPDGQSSENLYRLYTKALHVDDAGVVEVPARYRWSVETSWRGVDPHGNALPDARIMLRLYDPKQNFTALTAQMDLATAAKLHHELGEILVKKLQDPGYQHRPRLYDPKDIPTGRFQGIDQDGKAIIEFEYPKPRDPPK